ncbi:hypothetical protein, partial [Limnospira sp. Paracas R14]|uniref:hypothetical protein n=1 Tax=Limnospira sp. Paracas R14 TaxID=2981108 RepID=UPI0028E14949|nr:hypothetical protein [Limnospira sp. Paracas R14]
MFSNIFDTAIHLIFYSTHHLPTPTCQLSDLLTLGLPPPVTCQLSNSPTLQLPTCQLPNSPTSSPVNSPTCHLSSP